jgi:hypothetical protein
MAETVHLTVAQATVRFLSQQYSESDGVEHKFFEGCFGTFGYGNVAGLGHALLPADTFADRSASPLLRELSPSASRRTCRRRPSTGRSSCWPSGSGTTRTARTFYEGKKAEQKPFLTPTA